MTRLTRFTIIAAATGGTLWTVKALVIAARDGSFGPLESVFFLSGLALQLSALVTLAIVVSRRWSGITRVGGATATVIVGFATLLAIESIGKSTVAGLASGDNLGWEQEGGVLAMGLSWLVAAGVFAATRRPTGLRPAPGR